MGNFLSDQDVQSETEKHTEEENKPKNQQNQKKKKKLGKNQVGRSWRVLEAGKGKHLEAYVQHNDSKDDEEKELLPPSYISVMSYNVLVNGLFVVYVAVSDLFFFHRQEPMHLINHMFQVICYPGQRSVFLVVVSQTAALTLSFSFP